MEKNEIRAVDMVREIRDALYDETKDLSREELKAFIARGAAEALRQVPMAGGQPLPGRSAA